MNLKITFVLVILAAFLVLGEGGRRRRNRNCPRSDSESNGDHWCCDVKTENVTRWDFIWWPCDEIEAVQEENGGENPPDDQIEWSEHSRKRRSGDHGWWGDWCIVWVRYNVTIVYNDWKCCDGWSMDLYGYCSIADDGSTDIYCDNGGTPMDNAYCVCPDGFIGTHCETPVCTPACQNNGHCSARDGRPICVCPENFAGDYCETPVCDRPCQNGGLCVAEACETRCRCKAGYAGKYCEIVIKEGECPMANSFGTCQEACNTDTDCLGVNKCCSNGCGHECMKPINSSRCVYKNRTYNVGERMFKDDCTTCLCQGEGMTSDPSGFDCFTITCTVWRCPDGMVMKTTPGQCCGQCEAIECPNGCGEGKCKMVNGSPQCACPSNFQGESCQIPVCASSCLNGGTCMASGSNTYCACDPAYTGYRCEIKVESNEGLCPSVNESTEYCRDLPDCQFDSQCEGHQKCCYSECGLKCMTAVNQDVCILGGVTYRKGEFHQRSACESCQCMGQGQANDPSGFMCNKMMCAQIMCAPGYVYTVSKEVCCPFCEEGKTPDPTFTKCPEKITIEVNSYDSLVNLEKSLLPKLEAVDGLGQPLEISLSQRQLRHCACPHSQRNIHNIVASTAPDNLGRTATCAVAVRVKDVHPPRFTSCPTNIEVFTKEIVTWDRPKVGDNVGINSIEFFGSQRNNTFFLSGSFLLGYKARDYEGNVAVCQFTVSVWEEDSTDISMPHQMKKIQEDNAESKSLFIGIGAALGILIAIAVGVALFICCRRSAARAAPPKDTSHNQGYDNGIYAIYGTPPPDYDYPGKDKLPQYSVSEPPEYESVDPFPQKSQGVENPTYVSTIDVKFDLDNKINESLSE